MASSGDLDGTDDFIMVKSRKKSPKANFGKNGLTGTKSSHVNKIHKNSSRIFSSLVPGDITDSFAPEEYSTDIEAIHSSILRLRSRILQDCGPLFLPNLIQSFQRSFEGYLNIHEPEEIVCYALGRFSVPSDWGFSCRLQLILLQELANSFQIPVFIFDPAFSPLEKAYLSSKYCGFSTISENEEAKRCATRSTLFFMVHADAFLYDNLIETNRLHGSLGDVILFGNTRRPEVETLLTSRHNFSSEASVPQMFSHVEKKLPMKDRSGLFSVALTSDTVLHFFLPGEPGVNGRN